jgi:hypothetical protein
MIWGTFNVCAQELNEYKYVIVPEEFDFSKEENQYQLNALTKFLFEKFGFETLMRREVKPLDLQGKPCLGLTTSVKDNSGLFVTKLVVQLEDCSGNIVFQTKEGRSRLKDFKEAYHEALRNAFSDIQDLNYQYEPEKRETSPEMNTELAQTRPKTQAVEASQDRKVTAAETEVPAGKPMDFENSAKELDFEKEGITYFLEKSDSGYSFFQQNSEEPFAVLAKSGGKDSFIYKSLTHQGIAYFDQEGNLVVEYLDATNKPVTLVYIARANQ